jgi:small-conductance mechanosensitive channel
MITWLPQIDSSIALDSLKSLLLLLSVLIARILIVRSIAKNSALTMEAKRRWVVTVRNSMVFVFLLGLAVIWAHELQAFAVSLVALAAALVLATKELLLCWSGAALRVGGKVYSVGDRIQIAGHRGVVLDHDIFATKLLEIGPGQASHLYTGRVTVFPNSMLFTNALVKENPGQEYGLYTLTVPLPTEQDWKRAETRLLEAAKAECTPFMQEASRQMKLLEQRNLLEAPSPEPRITIQLSDAGRIVLVLRFPAPDRGRSRIEQAILRRYLSPASLDRRV